MRHALFDALDAPTNRFTERAGYVPIYTTSDEESFVRIRPAVISIKRTAPEVFQ